MKLFLKKSTFNIQQLAAFCKQLVLQVENQVCAYTLSKSTTKKYYFQTMELLKGLYWNHSEFIFGPWAGFASVVNLKITIRWLTVRTLFIQRHVTSQFMTSFKRYNAFTFKRPRIKAGTYQLINLIFRSGSTIRSLEKLTKFEKNLPIIDSWSLCLVDCVTGESPGLIKPITGVVKNLDISNLKPRNFLQILCRAVSGFQNI